MVLSSENIPVGSCKKVEKDRPSSWGNSNLPCCLIEEEPKCHLPKDLTCQDLPGLSVATY